MTSQIEEQVGGASGVSSPSDMAKNREQVYNQGRNVTKPKSRSTGPAKIPNLEKLIMLQQSYDFFKKASFSVKGEMCKPNTFATTNNHLMWVPNVCRLSLPLARFHVNMTYKCGPFYLTVLTMPHPMFVYRKTPNKHPSIFVGMCTSVSIER